MQFQRWANNDDRTTRVVNALTQKVLAETTLFTLQHVRQRFQRTLVGTGDDAATTTVVEQGIDRFLQHTLFVANDDVWRTQFNQTLQTVVPVDNAPVQIVEIRGCETATIQRHQWAQLWRNNRQDIQHHPLRACAAIQERLNQLEPLHDLLFLGLTGCGTKFSPQRFLFKLEIEAVEHPLHCLSTDQCREAVFTVLILRCVVLIFSQQLVLLQTQSGTRINNDEVLEVQDTLEILQGHVQQQADPAWQ